MVKGEEVEGEVGTAPHLKKKVRVSWWWRGVSIMRSDTPDQFEEFLALR